MPFYACTTDSLTFNLSVRAGGYALAYRFVETATVGVSSGGGFEAQGGVACLRGEASRLERGRSVAVFAKTVLEWKRYGDVRAAGSVERPSKRLRVALRPSSFPSFRPYWDGLTGCAKDEESEAPGQKRPGAFYL